MRQHHTPVPGPVPAPASALQSKAFRDWFLDSQVVDPDGAPLMVFHGTARLDRAFRAWRWRDCEGAYFTSDFSEALIYADMDSEIEGYQPYVISAFVQLSNPFFIDGIDSHEITTIEKERLVALGHDGVIGNFDGVIREYIVFNPSQIAPLHQGVLNIPEAPLKLHQRRTIVEDASPSP